MRCMGESGFGASVLVGSDSVAPVNANGLPSVSSSVKMIGRFHRLLSLNHPNLCQYIDLLRCTSVANSIILISENYESSLADCLLSRKFMYVADLASQITSAVAYLHAEGLCLGFLRSSSVRISPNGSPRLAQYGLRFVTDDSRLLLDILNHDFYMAPELILSNEWQTTLSSDIWALGVVLLELSLGTTLETVWSLGQYLTVLEELSLSDTPSVYDALFRAIRNTCPSVTEPSQTMADIIRRCLSVFPSQRPFADEIADLLSSGIVAETDDWETVDDAADRVSEENEDWKVKSLPLDTAFFLWKLCGCSTEALLIKNGHIHVQYPIMTLPTAVLEDMRLVGNDDGRRCCSPLDVFPLPSSNLLEKLSAMDDSIVNRSVELDGLEPNAQADLALLVKEKDVAYQLCRTSLVRHLLNSPNPGLLRSAITRDIPPLVRGDVWAHLLGVSRGDSLPFFLLDTLAPHSSDRQLDVDIPRCHQYDELMTSPAAHWKLRRLLKAWLLSHDNYVYWQGCDSLSTPFLILHFNNLPTALSCLSVFVNKYLYNFFLKDNSAVIQEHLAVFFHLLAYIDAKFYSTLVTMDFYPELFAIPWFLTCFAHVLPIHKLLHVWDVLLLHDSSFPLFLGLALLRQLRPQIMDSTFNDVILLFSDLPDMSMDRVIEDSQMFFSRVPPSCARRCLASEVHQETDEPLRRLPCSLRLVPHSELRKWHCPRLSPEEFAFRVANESIVVLDVRSRNEFLRGHVVRSFNCQPNATALLSIGEVLRAAQRNQHPICVIGGKDVEAAKEFVSLLVLERHVDGVCVLDGGFDGVRDRTDIIGIPE